MLSKVVGNLPDYKYRPKVPDLMGEAQKRLSKLSEFTNVKLPQPKGLSTLAKLAQVSKMPQLSKEVTGSSLVALASAKLSAPTGTSSAARALSVAAAAVAGIPAIKKKLSDLPSMPSLPAVAALVGGAVAAGVLIPKITGTSNAPSGEGGTNKLPIPPEAAALGAGLVAIGGLSSVGDKIKGASLPDIKGATQDLSVEKLTAALPSIRTCSQTRARLFKGGTYFRSREVGLQQNQLSVQLIEYSGPTTASPDAVCVIMNHNNLHAENLEDWPFIKLLKVELPFNEYVEIDQLHTRTPRARHYSISAQIGAAPVQLGDDIPFSFNAVITIPDRLKMNLAPDPGPLGVPWLPTDKLVVKPRFRIHRLETEVVNTGTTETPVMETVWSITKLRTRVNADNPWVEMLPRSGATAPTPENPTPAPPTIYDHQDDGLDAPGLTLFGQTFLTGGDGLPATPNNENTGPTRAVIHVNYGENEVGKMVELNQVYEWAGDSASQGSWKAFSPSQPKVVAVIPKPPRS